MELLRQHTARVLEELVPKIPECLLMASPSGLSYDTETYLAKFTREVMELIKIIAYAEHACRIAGIDQTSSDYAYADKQLEERQVAYDSIITYTQRLLESLSNRRAIKIAESIIEAEVSVLGDQWERVSPSDDANFSEFQAALIFPQSVDNEDSRIEVFSPIRRFLDKCIADPEFLFHFSKHHRDFEIFIADCYLLDGWENVELTPQRGDGGRDVIATRSDIGTIRILEQTKAYSRKTLVTHDDVRTMLGVLSIDRSASKGIITTTSDFQPRVMKSQEFAPFFSSRLELRNGEQLRRWLASIKA